MDKPGKHIHSEGQEKIDKKRNRWSIGYDNLKVNPNQHPCRTFAQGICPVICSFMNLKRLILYLNGLYDNIV